MVMDEAGTSEINHLDLTARIGLDKDVLRLQIAVNKLERVDVVEGVQDLLGNSLESRHVEVEFLFNFSVVLGVLV